MQGDLIKINKWLIPFSWLYSLAVEARNLLFDIGILKSESFAIPIINVGNITVGGTGKTPHVEHLIRLLSPKYKVGVLSRGYRRKSNGYRLATAESSVEEIGDEPWQIKHKFPHIHMAVDSNRRRGIKHLINDPVSCDVEVILLDDAYQHRYVRPGMNILLVDYHRMITDDALLPAGRLRESASAKSRADVVIVTKCPLDTTPIGFRVIQSSLRLKPFQRLFFSTLKYGNLRQLYGDKTMPVAALRTMHVLMLSGIGLPMQMEQDLRRYTPHITPLTFRDHHFFTAADGKAINTALKALPQPSVIVTTEKDATRLLANDFMNEKTKDKIYVLPVEVGIMRDRPHAFNTKILNYVQSDKRNFRMAKGKDA